MQKEKNKILFRFRMEGGGEIELQLQVTQENVHVVFYIEKKIYMSKLKKGLTTLLKERAS